MHAWIPAAAVFLMGMGGRGGTFFRLEIGDSSACKKEWRGREEWGNLLKPDS